MLFAVAAGLTPLVLTLAGTFVVRAIERAREARRHTNILAELGPPAAAAHVLGAARQEVVTVEGKLVALGDTSTGTLASFHPYGTSFLDEVNLYAVSASTAPQGFAVELDGGAGRALLEGRAQVLTGAVETEHDAPLEQATALEAASLAGAKVKKRIGQFRVLRPGDRVRARGAVEPAPDDDALYRNKSKTVRMTPAPVEGGLGEPTIAVAATSSRRQSTSRSPVLRAAGVSLVAGAVLAVGAARIGPPPSLRPQSRVVAEIDAGPVEPPCRGEVRAKVARYGSDAANGCLDPFARALARYAAGEFQAASDEFAKATSAEPAIAPSLAEVETHLFVHSFDRAAATVRRMLAQFYPGPSTTEKRLLECILEVIESRAQAPRERGPYFVKPCSLRPFNKVARELDSEGSYGGQDDWPRATYRRDARYEAVGEPYTSVVSTRARLAARPVALERGLLDRLITPHDKVAQLFPVEAANLYPLLATYAAELVLFYAYAGFPERAGPYWPFLDRVAKMVEESRTFYEGQAHDAVEKKRIREDEDHLTFVMAVAGAAALHAGETARMERYSKLSEPYTGQTTRQMAKMTRAKSVWEEPEVDRSWPESEQVFAAALKQDAAAIARVLTQMRSTGRNTLPRAIPQLGSADRAPLLTWFRSETYPAACPECGGSTFLGDLSDRREVARLLGDTNEHARLRASAERFTDALTDPVIGFELDELETFFSKRK